MFRMASGESQWSKSAARGWFRRSRPVFFSYSLKAASNMDWKLETETFLLRDADMMLMGLMGVVGCATRTQLGFRLMRLMGVHRLKIGAPVPECGSVLCGWGLR